MIRVSTLALTALALASSPAYAALDALCGTTITQSVVLDHDVDCTGYTGTALTIGASNITVDGAGFRLLAPDASRAISITGQANVTIRDLAVEGWCTGQGVYIDGGSGHVLDQVVASGRSVGIYAQNTSGLVIRDAEANSCSTQGLSLKNTTGLVLERLVLDNNATGLRLDTITGPLTLGTAQITSIAGNDTSIELFASVSGVTIDGLTLDGWTTGLLANAATINNVTVRDVDASHTAGLGTGINLRGNTHTLQRVVANRRNIGVNAATVTDLTIDDLTANGAIATGLALSSVTGTLSLRKLRLEDDATAFSLTTYAPASQLLLTRYDAGSNSGTFVSLVNSDNGLVLSAVQNLRVADLTLDNATVAIDASASTNANHTYEDLVLSGPRTAGYGLYLRGAGHTVRRVVANRRSYGVRAIDTNNLTLTDLTAKGCVEGLRLEALPSTFNAPTLARLTLTDDITGLVLAGVATPLTISPTTALDVRRSGTGVTVTSSSSPAVTSKSLTFEDLTFDNPEYGVNANITTNSDLVFRRVDFSGPYRGIGLYLGGPRHVLDTVTASGRATAFQLTTTSQVTLTDVSAHHNSVGLELGSLNNTHVAPTVSGLDLSDNNTALYLTSVSLPFTIGATWGLDTSGVYTAMSLNNVSNLIVADVSLRGVTYGVYTSGASTASLTFDNVDVGTDGTSIAASTYRGVGLYLIGPNHTLVDVTAHRRRIGVFASGARGLSVTNLAANNCSEAGLSINSIAAAETAPVLSGLDLRDNLVGLVIDSVASPLTIEPATGLDVRGSWTGIYTQYGADLTVRNLTLAGNRSYAIHAERSNTRLTLQNLDVSGDGVGYGIKIGYLSANSTAHYGGVDHLIENVIANQRGVGLDVIAASNLRVLGFTSNRSGTGLRIESSRPWNRGGGVIDQPPPFTQPTLRDLDLADNAFAFGIYYHTPSTPLVIGPYDALSNTGAITSMDGSDIGLYVIGCSNVAFEDLDLLHTSPSTYTYGVVVESSTNVAFRRMTLASSGIGIRATTGNTGLTFEELDLSGQGAGTGLLIGAGTTTAGNYGGQNHVVRDVIANWRTDGVIAYGASNLTVDGLEATHNDGRGLYIEGYTGIVAPTLSGLTLEDNSTGLSLSKLDGTSLAPIDLGPASFTSIVRNGTSIALSSSSYVRVHDLTLDGSTAGLDASGTSFTVTDLVATGLGYGAGVKLSGANHVAERITADLRDYGVQLTTTTNPTLRNITARRNRTAGVQLTTTTLPITLEALSLSDNRTGLGLTTVNGTGSLTVGTSAIATLARSQTGISLSAAAVVTVDTVALGLTQSANTYNPPTPASDPLCGTTITANLTLTADLDCSGITSPAYAITLGADNLTIDGGPSRFKIIAPRAAAVVRALNRNNATVRNLDLSGTWAFGDGVSIDGGSGHVVDNVLASTRDRGVHLRNASNSSVTNLTTRGNLTSGLHLETVTRPITLAGLSLTDGLNYGLRVNGYDGLDPGSGLPQTLDSSTLTNLAGNATSIFLEANVKNLAFVGPLTGLDGVTTAISGNAATNANLTFRDLVLDAPRSAGTGMLLGGSNHTVQDCQVKRRATGFDLRTGTGLTLDGVQATDLESYAMTLDNALPTTMKQLTLKGSSSGLELKNLNANNLLIGPYSALTDSGVMAELSDNVTDLRLAAVSNLRVEDLALSGATYGVYAATATNSNLALSRLDVARTRAFAHNGSYGANLTSTGVALAGSNHTVTDLDVAHYYGYGLDASTVTNLTLSHVTVDDATTSAISLSAVTLPLNLTDLTGTRSTIAVQISGLAGDPLAPFVIRPYNGSTGAITSTTGSATGLRLANVQNTTLEDLTLPNASNGIDAGTANNTNLTFRRLNLSGSYGGYGLYALGSNHLVEDVTANHRAYGLSLTGNGHTLRRVTARYASAQALALATMTTPPALTDLTLSDSAVGLALTAVAGTSGAPFVIGAYSTTTGTGAIRSITNCYDGISLSNVQHTTIEDLTLDAGRYGVTGYVTSNANLTLDDLDLSPKRAGGTGLYLAGANHTLTDLVSRHRDNAVLAGLVSNLRLERLDGRYNSTSFQLQNMPDTPATYVAPTLSQLDVRDNLVAIYLDGVALPMTIDASNAIDFRGSKFALQLARSTGGYPYPANTTIRGLSNFESPAYSTNMGAPTITSAPILVTAASTNLVFEDLDLSGVGLGGGIYLSAPTDLTLRNVTANDRAYGAFISAPVRGLIEDFEARFSAAGLMLWSGAAGVTPPTLDGVVLTDNTEGLELRSWSSALTLSPASGLDLARSAYGIYALDTANLTLEDLTLSNPYRGLSATDSSSNARTMNYTLRRLDVSGTGRGIGIELRGAGHVLDTIVADDRQYGVSLIRGNGATINDLHAGSASEAGLYLNGLAAGETPPALNNVALVDSKYGVRIDSFAVPATFDASDLPDLTGNQTPVYLGTGQADLTLRGLVLPSPGHGVQAENQNNARLRLEDLDVAGYCRGTGLYLGGNDNVVTGTTAARRGTGIAQNSGDRLTITDSVVGANTTGVQVAGSSLIVNTTVVADATNTTTRVRVSTITYMYVGQTLRLAMPGGNEDRVITALASPFVTFGAALPSIPAAGTTVRALQFGDPRVTVSSSDICANGTGYAAGAFTTTATNNYWRSSTGPRHSSIPAGTGDLVTGTATTLSPFVPVPTDKANPYCNQAPVPDAGPDQTACEGDVVTLDGSASTDPDVEPLLYQWTQLSGATATLDTPTLALTDLIAPAPTAPANTETLTFELMVDDLDIQRTDETSVTITRKNPAPTAVAGPDQATDEGLAVSLSAAGSADPDGTTLTYQWVQVAGPTVTLDDPTAPSPTFTAPLLDVGGVSQTATLRFELTVTDEQLPVHCGGPQIGTDLVEVVVANVNHPPTAIAGVEGSGIAGLDGTADEGTTVGLEAVASADPDGDPLTYGWVQTSGTTVTLSGADTATPTFTAPDLPCNTSVTLTFEVTVDDGFGGLQSDEVAIVVSSVDADTDGDGVIDCEDGCPADPNKVAPGTCGCGVADADTDGDTTLDCQDGCPTDPSKIEPLVCGCGVAEADTDGDLTLDCQDGCPSDPSKTAPLLCGCGVADTDTDGDTSPDCTDLCDDDPAKTDPGQCGCGFVDIDTTGDGVADCADLCAAVSAEVCLGNPFYLTVRTPTGRGQIACVTDGVTIDCANVDGVAVITPVSARTSCE